MNKEGFTLVMLTITIIVLIIISSTIILKSNDLNKDAKALQFISNMNQIKSKVEIEMYNSEDFEPINVGDTYSFKGELLSTTTETINGITYPLTGENEQWYRFSDDTTTYPDAVSLEELGIYEIEGTYLVNYTTQKIVSKEGVKVDGVTYYTLDDIADVYDLGL